MNEKEIFKGLGVPITISDPDKFKVIRETLTRIGIFSYNKQTNRKTLTQTAHILHKKGHYAILLFFELFEMDGREAVYSADDIRRRNLIVKMLQDWGLCTVIDQKQIADVAPQGSVTVIKSSEKEGIHFTQKYKIGNEANKNWNNY